SLARASHLGDWIRREVKRTTSSLEKRAKISESEKTRLESVIANIEDGVIVLDEEKNVVLMNRVARSAFGLDSKELAGQPIDALISNNDLHEMLAKSEGSSVKYYELNFDDGRVFNAQHTPIPNIGSAITMQDITYLKRLDQLKNDFVHTVSHDLRSPLTAVMGYAELVERVGPLNEQQQEFLHRVKTSVQNITTLVNDLLDLGRLEAGFDARRETVQLESVLQYSMGLFDSLVQKKNIHLHKEIADHLPPLRANPIRIRQMIDNLVSNAIKYTPEGGEIHIILQAEDDQIIFQVSDSGPGIPRDEQARIFEKFYRASNVSEVKGTGLGLAIVKSIVDSHHGRVWVESVVNQGASFFVVLPAYEQKES
ncbi:MAG TPA: ATP-binding protein, partial [Anaerolineales bacterium]|nr:ATP-binding protein [Anaerolineales bacterium]